MLCKKIIFTNETGCTFPLFQHVIFKTKLIIWAFRWLSQRKKFAAPQIRSQRSLFTSLDLRISKYMIDCVINYNYSNCKCNWFVRTLIVIKLIWGCIIEPSKNAWIHLKPCLLNLWIITVDLYVHCIWFFKHRNCNIFF